MKTIINNWVKTRRAKSTKRKEILHEINNISEMVRLNAGVMRAAIDRGRFPNEPQGKPEYYDYATARARIDELIKQLDHP